MAEAETTPFDPTGWDYSEFEEDTPQWIACRERDRKEAEAINEMFAAQKAGGETYLAWIEKTKGSEARKKEEKIFSEVRRYGDEDDWYFEEYKRQQKAYWLQPGANQEQWDEHTRVLNKAGSERAKWHKEQMRKLRSKEYSEEDAAEEVKEGEGQKGKTLPVKEDEPQQPETIAAEVVSRLGISHLGTPKDIKEDAGQEPETSPVKEDDAQEQETSATEPRLEPSVLDGRHDSLVDVLATEKSSAPLSLKDESLQGFPSLPTTASAKHDSTPHPKSLYKKPSPIVLSSLPPAVSAVETPPKQTRPARLRFPQSTPAYAGRDNRSGPKILVLENRPAARSPQPAEKPAEESSTQKSTALESRPEKVEEESQPAKGGKVAQSPPPISAPKKQKKPTAETLAAAAAPVVVSEPISSRKRKEKKVETPKAPVSGRAAKLKPTKAKTPASAEPAVQIEMTGPAAPVSGSVQPSKAPRKDMARHSGDEDGGEMGVAFGAMLLLLVLVLLGGYSMGR
ncbi:hypothetical protein BST61_g10299 [Cercospora zeina]